MEVTFFPNTGVDYFMNWVEKHSLSLRSTVPVENGILTLQRAERCERPWTVEIDGIICWNTGNAMQFPGVIGFRCTPLGAERVEVQCECLIAYAEPVHLKWLADIAQRWPEAGDTIMAYRLQRARALGTDLPDDTATSAPVKAKGGRRGGENAERNEGIFADFKAGTTRKALATKYNLSYSTVKDVVRSMGAAERTDIDG